LLPRSAGPGTRILLGAALLPWLLFGCSNPYRAREVVVGPLPPGSYFMVLERKTGDGWQSVGDHLADAALHDKRGRLVGAEDIPGRNGVIPAREGWISMWGEEGGEFLVFALDSQRRWWAWTSLPEDQQCLPDTGPLGQDRTVVDVRRCGEPRPATDEELDRLQITVGRGRPLFEDPGTGHLPSSLDYYRTHSEFLLRTWRRYLGRCVGLADTRLGENRPLDASAAIADALDYFDLQTPVLWPDPARAATEIVFSEFLKLRNAAEKGDLPLCRESLGRIRAQLELLDPAKK